MNKTRAAGLALTLALIPAFTQADPPPPPPRALGLCSGGGSAIEPPARGVRLMAGYGDARFKIRTDSADAQAFFDNGLQLGHAFAHHPALAAFEEAARRDPNCAMCLWGQAWAGGATINFTVDDKVQAKMAELMKRATVLAADGPQLERDLIAAMVKRYDHGGGAGPGDDAYAEAMYAIAQAHPDSDELAVLAADALMVPDAQHGATKNEPRVVALLEGVLKRSPDNVGAVHFYIHATEMSGFAARAEGPADRLERLAPKASHLVHMPSHTYYWVGRYEDALTANQRASVIDGQNAEAQGLADGAFGLFYHGHNVQYGTAGALMSGDGAGALAVGRPAIARVFAVKAPTAWEQLVAGTAYAAEGRFAEPASVLALPDPKHPYLQAMWRYARGEALARTGDVAGVKREAALVRRDADQLKDLGPYAGQMAEATDLARLVLEGRAAMLEHRPKDAVALFRKAAEKEEAKFTDITDPPMWWYPPRRDLALALLASGDAKGAADEARATLSRRVRDPVALAILASAERKLGMGEAANAHMAEARKAWVGEPKALELASL